jgi:hypothetical protein
MLKVLLAGHDEAFVNTDRSQSRHALITMISMKSHLKAYICLQLFHEIARVVRLKAAT